LTRFNRLRKVSQHIIGSAKVGISLLISRFHSDNLLVEVDRFQILFKLGLTVSYLEIGVRIIRVPVGRFCEKDKCFFPVFLQKLLKAKRIESSAWAILCSFRERFPRKLFPSPGEPHLSRNGKIEILTRRNKD
jgi:hypothetical protein